MSDVKLGQLIESQQHRDAIHAAVAPVSSDMAVYPGQHVGLDGSSDKVSASATPTIGIVDPFLRHAVQPGQKFWLMLYPQTVTSLRHHWEHTAFKEDDLKPRETAQKASIDEKLASESWIKDYVRNHCPYWEDAPDGGYGEFLRYVERERWIFYNGSDCHDLSDVADAENLFHHLSVVLGRTINAHYFEAFTCSC